MFVIGGTVQALDLYIDLGFAGKKPDIILVRHHGGWQRHHRRHHQHDRGKNAGFLCQGMFQANLHGFIGLAGSMMNISPFG